MYTCSTLLSLTLHVLSETQVPGDFNHVNVHMHMSIYKYRSQTCSVWSFYACSTYPRTHACIYTQTVAWPVLLYHSSRTFDILSENEYLVACKQPCACICAYWWVQWCVHVCAHTYYENKHAHVFTYSHAYSNISIHCTWVYCHIHTCGHSLICTRLAQLEDVCLYVCVHIHMRTHTYICTYTPDLYKALPILRTGTHTCAHTCTPISRTQSNTYTGTSSYALMHTHTHTRKHIYIRTSPHTYIQTNIHPSSPPHTLHLCPTTNTCRQTCAKSHKSANIPDCLAASVSKWCMCLLGSMAVMPLTLSVLRYWKLSPNPDPICGACL